MKRTQAIFDTFERRIWVLLFSKLQNVFLCQERRRGAERAWGGRGFVGLDLKGPRGWEWSQPLLTIQL